MRRKSSARFIGLLILCLLFSVSSVTVFANDIPIKLSLEESKKYALEHNPVITQVKMKLKQTEFSVEEAKAGFLPKLNLSSNYTRMENGISAPKVEMVPLNVKDKNTGQETGEQVFVPLTTGYGEGSKNSFSTQLSLQYPIYTAGRLELGKEIAENSVSGAQLEYEKAVQELNLNVTSAYYGVLQAKHFTEFAKESVAQSERHLHMAQLNYQAGIVTKTDVLRAQVQLANSQQNLVKTQNGLELAEAAFKNFIGVPQENAVLLIDNIDYKPRAINIDEYTVIALEKRPEIRQFKINIDNAQKAKKINEASNKPTVILAGNYGWQDSKFSFDKGSWNFTVGMNVNLYDGGALKAKVAQSDTTIQQLDSTLKQLEQGIVLEVKQAYLNLQEIEKRMELMKLNLQQATENLKIMEARYETGMGTNSDVIDAQLLMEQVKITQIQTLFDANVSYEKLKKAIGEN